MVDDYQGRFGGVGRLFGSAVFVTGAFGFLAAGEVVPELTQSR